MFVITDLDYGGAETQLLQLATSLVKRKYEAHVVTMIKPQAFSEKLNEQGIDCTSLNMGRGMPDLRAVIRLVALLRSWQPQIIHSHMVHANLLARLARLIHKAPVLICTAHSIKEGRRWREIAYRLTDPLADLTTNVSRAAVSRYIQVGAVTRDKIMYIPNGINTDMFKANRIAALRLREELGIKDHFAWLSVGRFEAVKDHPNMLRAFSVVAREREEAVLLLVGKGNLIEETKKLACDSGLKDRVRFLGVRRDVPELMNAADAYIMSSAWEGLPMVLLEAGSCGLPIVATDVGGNSEVVLEGESGYIVPPRDPVALATAMRKMMTLSEAERTAMGQTGRGHIEANYSLDRVVDQWEALYQELLQRKEMRIVGG